MSRSETGSEIGTETGVLGTTCVLCSTDIEPPAWSVTRPTTDDDLVTLCDDCDDRYDPGLIRTDALATSENSTGSEGGA